MKPITFVCKKCGNEIELITDVMNVIIVCPCEECLAIAYLEGFKDGEKAK